MKETVFVLADEDAYNLLRVDHRLSTLCRKGCPGREAHWSRYLISMKNSRLYVFKVTGCRGPLSEVSWSLVPGQEPDQELVPTPAILNYEIYWGSELARTLPALLSSGTGP